MDCRTPAQACLDCNSVGNILVICPSTDSPAAGQGAQGHFGARKECLIANKQLARGYDDIKQSLLKRALIIMTGVGPQRAATAGRGIVVLCCIDRGEGCA